MTKNSSASAEDRRRTECVCINLRRMSRVVSQIYDDALAPAGLKITQFCLLRAIERLGPASVGVLADDQELDRTTLTRNLALLERDGLIEQAPGADKQNLPPSAGMQFFGHCKIEGATGQLTVTLRDRADTALWSVTLDPKLG